MALLLLRRASRPSILKFDLLFVPIRLITRFYSSKTISGETREDGLMSIDNGRKDFASYSGGVRPSPLFTDAASASFDIKNIQVVDAETWKVSAGLLRAWRGTSESTGNQIGLGTDEMACKDVERHRASTGEQEEDFDRIDDMRIRGNLFYKLEKASKEFEEYSLEFHRRKSKKGEQDHKETKSKERQRHSAVSNTAKLPEAIKKSRSTVRGIDVLADTKDRSKKLRNPTFNQLTGPYHEPFCLDIYISKASVRACVVHRVTSKVVAVAHSISKDMKFDLGSSRNVKPAACAAAGEILARRALADDIHDVVYTPRKGEKLEGKLMVVLQAIINGGVNVKVKLKQRKKSKKEINLSSNARP